MFQHDKKYILNLKTFFKKEKKNILFKDLFHLKYWTSSLHCLTVIQANGFLFNIEYVELEVTFCFFF